MMPMSAVDEDAKLDRKEAARVLRRAALMLRPYKRDVIGAGILVTISTLAVLAGPFLLKVGIDRGITAGEEGILDLAVVAFVAVATLPGDTARFSDAALARRTTYRWRVRAGNAKGLSVASAAVTATTLR